MFSPNKGVGQCRVIGTFTYFTIIVASLDELLHY